MKKPILIILFLGLFYSSDAQIRQIKGAANLFLHGNVSKVSNGFGLSFNKFITNRTAIGLQSNYMTGQAENIIFEEVDLRISLSNNLIVRDNRFLFALGLSGVSKLQLEDDFQTTENNENKPYFFGLSPYIETSYFFTKRLAIAMAIDNDVLLYKERILFENQIRIGLKTVL